MSAARSRCVRKPRGQLEARFATEPPSLVGMKLASARAHHVSRRFRAIGHDARLTPPKYVRPYSEEQNNDFRDAHAIAEAVQRCAECVCGAEPFQKLLCLMADYADCRTEILMITAIRNTLVHRVSLIHAMG